ncbi:MAG: lytic murein transglycosylase [Xanthobacteraceae bacterium]|nr:lytic murein transglycosylase [Xanthobacteraceae bacterium]
MRRTRTCLAWLRSLALPLMTLIAAGVPALAQSTCRNTANFDQWLAEFKREAAAQKISASAIAAASPYLKFDQRIINIDRGQRFFAQNFLDFSKKVIPAYRLQRGAQLIKKQDELFRRIEKDYGVPAPVIVAFWGLESDFGASAGKEPVLPALTTLAYDCRRPELFRPRLFDALRMIERGDLRPEEMIGSWAGELGQTQMMTSEYYRSAVDYDGDGRRDLIRSVPDVLASTANYLQHLGWKRGQPWIQEVRVPQNLSWEQADLAIQHPRSQWAKWGVTRADGKPLETDTLPASLVLPMGRLGPAFLAFDNFRVYTEWNNSLIYSLSAAYYASRLAGAPAYNPGMGEKIPGLSQDEVRELQTLLAKRGFDVGRIDGILGLKSRQAVRTIQIKLKLPADSWPTAELLGRLRSTN